MQVLLHFIDAGDDLFLQLSMVIGAYRPIQIALHGLLFIFAAPVFAPILPAATSVSNKDYFGLPALVPRCTSSKCGIGHCICSAPMTMYTVSWIFARLVALFMIIVSGFSEAALHTVQFIAALLFLGLPPLAQKGWVYACGFSSLFLFATYAVSLWETHDLHVPDKHSDILGYVGLNDCDGFCLLIYFGLVLVQGIQLALFRCPYACFCVPECLVCIFECTFREQSYIEKHASTPPVENHPH